MCCFAANKRKQFIIKMKLSNKQAVTLHYKWTIDWQWTSEWSNFNAGCQTLWSWILQISKYNRIHLQLFMFAHYFVVEMRQLNHVIDTTSKRYPSVDSGHSWLDFCLVWPSFVSCSIAHCVVLHYSFCFPVDHWGMMSLQLSWYFSPILCHYFLNMDRIGATDHPFKYLISLCICPSLSSQLSIIDLDSGSDTGELLSVDKTCTLIQDLCKSRFKRALKICKTKCSTLRSVKQSGQSPVQRSWATMTVTVGNLAKPTVCST